MNLGVEIGGTKLQIVAGDASLNIVERRRFNVEPDKGAAGIRAQLATILPELMAAFHPAGLGVGFGGPVDWRTGTIARSHQIEGWSEFKLGEWLISLTGLAVSVDNDANVGALGEALRGAGVGCNPVFYVTLGSGVGGGLVVDGRIYHGARPGESEIGHLRLDRQGTLVESRCSGWAVDKKIRQLQSRHPDGALSRMLGDPRGGEARFLAPALAQGDLGAKQILLETAEDLAFGLSHVVQLLHPEIIVLGGGLALVGDPLRDAVGGALRGLVMDVFAPGPRVALAALAEDAVPVGALHLASMAARPGSVARSP